MCDYKNFLDANAILAEGPQVTPKCPQGASVQDNKCVCDYGFNGDGINYCDGKKALFCLKFEATY